MSRGRWRRSWGWARSLRVRFGSDRANPGRAWQSDGSLPAPKPVGTDFRLASRSSARFAWFQALPEPFDQVDEQPTNALDVHARSGADPEGWLCRRCPREFSDEPRGPAPWPGCVLESRPPPSTARRLGSLTVVAPRLRPAARSESEKLSQGETFRMGNSTSPSGP